MTFDEYCSAIREANVNFVITRREESHWGLEYCVGNALTVQFGRDGAASIADGIVPPRAFIILCRHNAAPSTISMNGTRVDDRDFIVLPPASHFIFAADAPRGWIAVAVPLNYVVGARLSGKRYRTRTENVQVPAVVKEKSEMHNVFVRCAEEFKSALSAQGSQDSPAEVEGRLLHGCLDVVAAWQHSECNRAELHSQDALLQVSRSLQLLHGDGPHDRWYVDDLARAAEVSTRTLLRSFHQIVGMGPVRYLRLRQLNLIRKELRTCASRGIRVTQAMQTAGASELGRVAGAYKALFGERPSETLRRTLAYEDREADSLTIE